MQLRTIRLRAMAWMLVVPVLGAAATAAADPRRSQPRAIIRCVTHHRRVVSAEGAPEAIGPYSHAVISNGLLFCSGQVPLDPATGELIDGSVGEQTTRCLENLRAVCESAGAQLSDAVRLTVYAADLPGDWAEINEAYGAYFASEPPARAAIGVAALPKGARVEIDAVVALPD